MRTVLGGDGGVAHDHVARIHARQLAGRRALGRLGQLEGRAGMTAGAQVVSQPALQHAPVGAQAHPVHEGALTVNCAITRYASCVIETAAGKSRRIILISRDTQRREGFASFEALCRAKRYKLPRALWPFVAEHHGTGLMAFFYHKALELDPRADEHNFRYPGPRPHSREAAIVMLADGVEAASRSLVEPTPSRIRGVVARILDERAREGQLDDCGLTFRELAQVREAFIPILAAVHHPRVVYPSLEVPRRRELHAHRDRESLPRDQA